MKILITGASGYVGAALAKDLRQQYQIIATARDISRIPVGDVHKRVLDISSPEQAGEVIREIQPDIVVHAAALPKRSTAEEESFIRTNVEGIRTLAEAVANYSSAKLIMLSSGCAFKQKAGHIITTASERELTNAFSHSKNLAEQAVIDIFHEEPNRLAIVYPPVILHPSQQKGIIPYALADAQTNGIITNKVPGGHVNFISHIKFAELIAAIAEDSASSELQRYLITGNRFTTEEFFKKLQDLFQNQFGILCHINTEKDPSIETMCAMDESALATLKPDFDWGDITDTVLSIVKTRLSNPPTNKPKPPPSSGPGLTY